MSKEIERKWLFDYNMYFEELESLIYFQPCVDIKDYYFNNYCRLRNIGGCWYITVKSDGDLIRDEYEFPVYTDDIDFLPTPMLKKTRYFVDVKGLQYEVNVFKDLMIGPFPLITVELEMQSPSLVIEKLPAFCGEDITHNMNFYGYNLFKQVQKATEGMLKGPHKDNVIQLKKILDKKK